MRRPGFTRAYRADGACEELPRRAVRSRTLAEYLEELIDQYLDELPGDDPVERKFKAANMALNRIEREWKGQNG